MKTLKVITIKADQPTINNRIYPKDVLEKAISECQERISKRKFLLQLCATGAEVDYRMSIGVITSMKLNDEGQIEVEAEEISYKKALFDTVECLDVVMMADAPQDDKKISECKILYVYQTDPEDLPSVNADLFEQMVHEFKSKEEDNDESTTED